MVLLFQSNPLTPLSSQGWAIGSAIICTGLFIWAQVEAYKNRKSQQDLEVTFTTRNEQLRTMLVSQSDAQKKMAESVAKLAESITQQAEIQREQIDLIREIMSEQKLQSSQMMTITNGFQRVVEQLITVVRDKE